MQYDIGATVVINRCDECPAIIGKTAKVVCLTSEGEYDAVVLNFGRGRPQKNRPTFVRVADLSLAVPQLVESTD